MRSLLHIARGFLMGSADVVPGVSGGTVALVLGIYERLHAIRTGAAALGEAARGRFRPAWDRLKEVEWGFLAPLLAGIALAIVSLAAILETLLEDEPQNLAAVFFGLVLGSIPIAWSLVGHWDRGRYAMAAAVAVAFFLLLGLRGSEVEDPATLAFFGAGAVAIVAMILPGISGSFILLMLGMYEAVIAAVNDRDIAVLAVFALAAIISLALFSTLLDRLLADHHDIVMAALIGLMVGSLRVLWPWPDGPDTAKLGAPEAWGTPLLLGLAGFAVVTAIGWWAKRVAHH